MTIRFSDFADAGVQQKQSTRLPRTPEGFSVYGKHDSRDGSVKLHIQLPNTDDNSDNYTDVDVDGFEFVAIVTYGTQNGNPQADGREYDGGVITGLSKRGIYDIYGGSNANGQFSSTSLGIYQAGNDTRELGLRSQYRIFGVLRSVNGKAPKSVPELAQLFNDGPVPIVVDLNYHKEMELVKTATPMESYPKPSVYQGKLISYSGGKAKELKYNNGHQNVFNPVFKVTEMSAEQLTKMEEYCQPVLEVVTEYDRKVDVHDQLLKTLYNNGFKGKNSVGLINKLGDADIANADDLNEYLQKHGGFANLKASLDGEGNVFGAPQQQGPVLPFGKMPTNGVTPDAGGADEHADEDMDVPF